MIGGVVKVELEVMLGVVECKSVRSIRLVFCVFETGDVVVVGLTMF